MAEKNIEYFFWINFLNSYHYSLDVVDVGFDRHLKREAVGESNCFLNWFESLLIILDNNRLGSQSQVPEFYQE